MKRIAIFFPLAIVAPLFAISGCAVHKSTSRFVPLAPPVQPQQSSPMSVTIHLCSPDDERTECDSRRRQWDRKQKVKTMIELLDEEFPNIASVDTALRDRIAAIALWLATHKYD